MTMPFKIFRVKDLSMEPTIRHGNYVFVYRWARDHKEGNIIVLKHPVSGIHIIKRIDSMDNDRVFVTGDNKDSSEDSRHFGSVYKSNIVGRVIRITR